MCLALKKHSLFFSPSDDTVVVDTGDTIITNCGTAYDFDFLNLGRGLQFFNRAVQLDFCAISGAQVR